MTVNYAPNRMSVSVIPAGNPQYGWQGDTFRQIVLNAQERHAAEFLSELIGLSDRTAERHLAGATPSGDYVIEYLRAESIGNALQKAMLSKRACFQPRLVGDLDVRSADGDRFRT